MWQVFIPCKNSLILLSMLSLSLSSLKSSYPRSHLMSHGQSHLLYGWKKKTDIKTAHCWLITFKISLKKSLNAADTSYMELNLSYLFTTMLNARSALESLEIFEFILQSSHADPPPGKILWDLERYFRSLSSSCKLDIVANLTISLKSLQRSSLQGHQKYLQEPLRSWILRVLCITEYPIGSLAEFHQ